MGRIFNHVVTVALSSSTSQIFFLTQIFFSSLNSVFKLRKLFSQLCILAPKFFSHLSTLHFSHEIFFSLPNYGHGVEMLRKKFGREKLQITYYLQNSFENDYFFFVQFVSNSNIVFEVFKLKFYHSFYEFTRSVLQFFLHFIFL